MVRNRYERCLRDFTAKVFFLSNHVPKRHTLAAKSALTSKTLAVYSCHKKRHFSLKRRNPCKYAFVTKSGKVILLFLCHRTTLKPLCNACHRKSGRLSSKKIATKNPGFWGYFYLSPDFLVELFPCCH